MARKDASNENVDLMRFRDMDLAIEWPKGSIRKGKDEQGNPWEREMFADYGFIKNTLANGDEEPLDVYVGDNEDAANAYVIEQLDDEGEFDEYKVMLGFNTLEEARDCYLAHYPADWDYEHVSSITEVPIEDLENGVDKHKVASPMPIPYKLKRDAYGVTIRFQDPHMAYLPSDVDFSETCSLPNKVLVDLEMLPLEKPYKLDNGWSFYVYKETQTLRVIRFEQRGWYRGIVPIKSVLNAALRPTKETKTPSDEDFFKQGAVIKPTDRALARLNELAVKSSDVLTKEEDHEYLWLLEKYNDYVSCFKDTLGHCVFCGARRERHNTDSPFCEECLRNQRRGDPMMTKILENLNLQNDFRVHEIVQGTEGGNTPSDDEFFKNANRFDGNTPDGPYDFFEEPELGHSVRKEATPRPAAMELGCVMVPAPKSVLGQIPIAPEDLHGLGMEHAPHITVRYGLLDSDLTSLQQLAEITDPFTVTLGKTNYFPPSQYSGGACPVYVSVYSSEIKALSSEVEEVAEFAPRSHAEYIPHLTIGYVRPEVAEKYKGLDNLSGFAFSVNEFLVSESHQETTIAFGQNAQNKPRVNQVNASKTARFLTLQECSDAFYRHAHTDPLWKKLMAELAPGKTPETLSQNEIRNIARAEQNIKYGLND